MLIMGENGTLNGGKGDGGPRDGVFLIRGRLGDLMCLCES